MPRLQVNLLPDIKLQAAEQAKSRSLIVTGAFIVTSACLAIFLILAAMVYGIQKKQLSNSNKAIEQSTAQLKSIPNLDRVLTVQGQLKSLTQLHHAKHSTSRLFVYLTRVTPSNISIGHVSLDLATNTMQLDGTASSQHAVNVFIDTLKFATYKLGQEQSLPAFNSVVETSFGIIPGGATYSINLKVDPALFANSKLDANSKVVVPKLQVIKKTTTRSVLEDPNQLFNGQNTKGTGK